MPKTKTTTRDYHHWAIKLACSRPDGEANAERHVGLIEAFEKAVRLDELQRRIQEEDAELARLDERQCVQEKAGVVMGVGEPEPLTLYGGAQTGQRRQMLTPRREGERRVNRPGRRDGDA